MWTLIGPAVKSSALHLGEFFKQCVSLVLSLFISSNKNVFVDIYSRILLNGQYKIPMSHFQKLLEKRPMKICISYYFSLYGSVKIIGNIWTELKTKSEAELVSTINIDNIQFWLAEIMSLFTIGDPQCQFE